MKVPYGREGGIPPSRPYGIFTMHNISTPRMWSDFTKNMQYWFLSAENIPIFRKNFPMQLMWEGIWWNLSPKLQWIRPPELFSRTEWNDTCTYYYLIWFTFAIWEIEYNDFICVWFDGKIREIEYCNWTCFWFDGKFCFCASKSVKVRQSQSKIKRYLPGPGAAQVFEVQSLLMA